MGNRISVIEVQDFYLANDFIVTFHCCRLQRAAVLPFLRVNGRRPCRAAGR